MFDNYEILEEECVIVPKYKSFKVFYESGETDFLNTEKAMTTEEILDKYPEVMSVLGLKD